MPLTRLPLTTGVSGTLPDANAPSGSVLQVVQGSSTTEFTQSTPTTSTVYFPSSNKISASITPISTSSKILVQYVSTLKVDDADNDGGVAMAVKETISGGTTTTIKPQTNAYASGFYFSSHGADNYRIRLHESVFRSPSTTSQITYEVGVMAYGASVAIKLNDTGSRGEIILMEIAG